MTTLVTGGTGFVGGAVARHLMESGREVRGLSRGGAGDDALRRLGVAPVRGDVMDPESLRRAMAGVDVVYHLAGVNAFCLADPSPMMRTNVEGSRNVAAAAGESGIRRLVYTSSAAAVGEEEGTIGKEDSPHRGSYLSAYERSKHLAEEVVLAEAGELDVVVVSPSSVQGPGRATGTGKIILDLATGKLPAVVHTRISVVDVADCARGHLLAEQRGISGERYLLNGFTATMEEALALLAEVLGRPVDVRFAPAWMAMAGATAVEGYGRIRGNRPWVCREMVRTLVHGHAYDGSRATRELGLEYTPAGTTVRRLVDWFRGEGLLAHPSP